MRAFKTQWLKQMQVSSSFTAQAEFMATLWKSTESIYILDHSKNICRVNKYPVRK